MTLELIEDTGAIRLHLSTGSSRDTYSGTHNALSGRDAEAAHPISAIDGLTGILAGLRSDVDAAAGSSAISTLRADLEELERTHGEDMDDVDEAISGLRDDLAAEATARGTLATSTSTALAGMNAALASKATVDPWRAATGTHDGDILLEEVEGTTPEVTVAYATLATLSSAETRINSRMDAGDAATLAAVSSQIGTAASDALAEAKAYTDARATGAYHVKGSITNAGLAALSPTVGDVYNISDNGTYPQGANVVYTTDGWDALAATVNTAIYDGHLAARDNPHGVTLEQIATADELAAIRSGATAAIVSALPSAMEKLGGIEDSADANRIESITAGGAPLAVDDARAVAIDGIVATGPDTPGACALIWYQWS